MYVPAQALAVLALILSVMPAAAMASADTARLCDDAAWQAAGETGVPVRVMLALTRVETGRDQRKSPWPWAVNQGGEGLWFDTRPEAEAYAAAQIAAGASNLDIGCFQLNWGWHGRAFPSVAAMFDPLANARYAARYLKGKYAGTGDWSKAAGAYHSATPDLAKRYRQRFASVLSGLDAPVTAPVPEPPYRLAENRYPLLKPGGRGGLASLVPVTSGAAPLLARRPLVQR